MFKITKIKTRPKHYEIFAIKNDTNYKFVSLKNENNRSCEREDRIRTGKKYLLKNIFYLSNDSVLGKPIAPNLSVKYVVIDGGISISLDQRYRRRVYFSKDIDGLCLIR